MIQAALAQLVAPTTLLAMLLAGIFGLLVGAVPGLTATMAIALLVPSTFYMEPVPAIAAMVAASAMAIFAGDLPAVLLRMPGTPASAAYIDAVHRMTLAGKAELALNFSSFAYFRLACLGLTCAAFVAGRDPLKGLVSLLLGLLFSSVGLDPITGVTRFTFGNVDMVGGLGLVPVLIGMFAVGEILRSVTTVEAPVMLVQRRIGNVFEGLLPVPWRHRREVLRGNVVGVLIGALPGVGADIAAWISYAGGRRRAERLRLEDGEGAAVASAGAANNASLGGAYVPATVFGIPGDSITAIVIGVLFMKGLTPGPTSSCTSRP